MSDILAAFLSTHPWILVVAAVWTIPWKGVALWRAARNRQIVWFLAFLVINTLAILEIIYIFRFSKKNLLNGEFDRQRVNGNGINKVILDIKGERH